MNDPRGGGRRALFAFPYIIHARRNTARVFVNIIRSALLQGGGGLSGPQPDV